jgi:probable HAF family extracellular repeat protein
MNTHKIATFAAILLSTISSGLAQSPPQYRVLDLGTLYGGYSGAQGINNSGQVVGYSSGLEENRAFLYSGGAMIDLGTLDSNQRNTVASAINSSGKVVGSSLIGERPVPCVDDDGDGECDCVDNDGDGECDPPPPPPPNATYAFLYSGGVMTNLGTLDTGAPLSQAYGVNDSGQVVGYSRTPAGDHAFLYSGGSMTDLDTMNTQQSIAFGINDAGQIVGRAYTSIDIHAFLFSGGSMTDLGTLGGDASEAFAINNSGQIVGRAYTSGNQAAHAFVYSGGSMTDLGTLDRDSEARAINSSGQIVGHCSEFGSAFLYSGGHMYNLNTLFAGSDYFVYLADDINDFGEVAATGRINFEDHALLLSPIAASAVVTVSANASYSSVPPLTNSNTPYHTTVALLGGNASTDQSVDLTFNNSLPASASAFQTASDVVGVSGTGSDTFVLQVSYNEAQAIRVFGTEADARLMWLDPTDNQWKLAVAGNTGGTPQVINRAYAPATDFQLGNYGVDTTNNVVWAVINHNSYFAIGKPPVPAVVYTATVQQPINRDGSSVFNAKRGVVPVKFTLTQNGNATCTLPGATIGVTRTAGGVVGAIKSEQ